MEHYETTRWDYATLSAEAKALKTQEASLLDSLRSEQDNIQDTINKAGLQFSIIRGEILQLQAEAVQSKGLSGRMSDVVDRVRALRLAIQEVNEAAEGYLIDLPS